MGKIKDKFDLIKPDFEYLKKLHKNNQQEYIRRRLKVIKLLWEGKSRAQVMQELNISSSAVLKYTKVIAENGVKDGLQKLVTVKKRDRIYKLTKEEQLEIIDMFLNKSPKEFGYESNIFTAKIAVEIVKEKMGKEVTDQAIYDMLKRHRISYQKAHRDYAEADKEWQREYVEELKKN